MLHEVAGRRSPPPQGSAPRGGSVRPTSPRTSSAASARPPRGPTAEADGVVIQWARPAAWAWRPHSPNRIPAACSCSPVASCAQGGQGGVEDRGHQPVGSSAPRRRGPRRPARAAAGGATPSRSGGACRPIERRPIRGPSGIRRCFALTNTSALAQHWHSAPERTSIGGYVWVHRVRGGRLLVRHATALPARGLRLPIRPCGSGPDRSGRSPEVPAWRRPQGHARERRSIATQSQVVEAADEVPVPLERAAACSARISVPAGPAIPPRNAGTRNSPSPCSVRPG